MKDITYTPEHYAAIISPFYPFPVTYDLLIESITSQNVGRGMDRFLCDRLQRAGIEDTVIKKLLLHSPNLARQERAGNMDEETRLAYADFILKESRQKKRV